MKKDVREKSRCWTFRYTEIWVPELEVCSREEIPPNLFIAIENPFVSDQPKPGQFNQFFHLAVEETLYHVYNDAVRRAVQHVASLIDSVLTIVQVTPWVSDEDCVDHLTEVYPVVWTVVGGGEGRSRCRSVIPAILRILNCTIQAERLISVSPAPMCSVFLEWFAHPEVQKIPFPLFSTRDTSSRPSAVLPSSQTL